MNVSIEKSSDLNVGPLDRVLILNSLLKCLFFIILHNVMLSQTFSLYWLVDLQKKKNN